MLPYWFTSIFYQAAKPFVTRYYGKRWWITAVNAHTLPVSGPVVLAGNHLKVHDSPLMAMTAGTPLRRVTFLAKSEFFKTRTLFGMFTTVAIVLLGQIPLNRSGAEASKKGLGIAERLLRRGKVIGIHVEGTRSRDGLLYDAKLGFAKIAYPTKATIVPVAFQYWDSSPEPGKRWARVIYGKPITHSEYQNMRPEDLAEYLIEQIAHLSGQKRAYKRATIATRQSSQQ